MIKIILLSIWLLLSPITYILTTKEWYNLKKHLKQLNLLYKVKMTKSNFINYILKNKPNKDD